MEIPKQVQDKLAQFQGIQNQLQLIALQKQQLMLQSTDTENALTELGKITDKGKIYRLVGPILIETNKKDSEKMLNDDKELIATRINFLEKQEKKLDEKFEDLKTELQGMLGKETGETAG